MASDIISQIGAVTREVRRGQRDGKPVQSVVASRAYETGVEDLWDAITNAERIPRWFLPVSGDLRLGGRYQIQGNAGGEITACEPPRRLAMTWEFGGNLTWVEVSLSPTDDGSWLELVHTALDDDLNEHARTYGPGAVGIGWDLSLFGLANYESGRSGVTPENAPAWMASEEGKACMRASGADWIRAHIASGAPRDHAEAAGARTIAFYTGEAAPDA